MKPNKKIPTTLLATLLLCGAMVTACSPRDGDKAEGEMAKVEDAKHESAEHVTPKAKPTQLTPDSWIVFDDEAVIPVMDELTRHLEAGHKALSDKQPREAASHLAQAAEVLENQEGPAADDRKPALEKAAEELEHISEQLTAGETVSEPVLARAFLAAHHADVDQRYLVDDTVTLLPYYQHPQHHFEKAIQDLADKNSKAAAGEIRKGAAYLRMEAASAEADTKEALLRSTVELSQLARDLETGVTHEKTDLEHAFARATLARAHYHQLSARKSWLKEDAAGAGHALQAAAADVENGFKWSGREVGKASSEVLDGAREMSGLLIEGSGWAVDKVGKGIEKVGSEVEKMGKWMASPDFDSTT
jgi:hypothetical protein